MKKILLKPEEILATDTSFPADDLAFRIYYHVIQKGGSESLPPIIVGTIESFARWTERLEEKYAPAEARFAEEVRFRRKEYSKVFGVLRTTPYFILDGNHRALAAALNRQPIRALHLHTDDELHEIDRMVVDGEILSFPHSTESIDALAGKLLREFLKLNDIPPNHGVSSSKKFDIETPKTMRTRAYELITAQKLPRYMIKNYRAGRDSGGPRMVPAPPRLSW